MADKVFFVTFRVADVGNYDERRNALYEQIRYCAVGRNYWQEPTSFVAFESGMHSDDIIAILRSVIDERYDLLALGSLTHKTFIIIGKNSDQDIFAFCDFAKVK